MPDRDKVINGLECCSVGCVGENNGCPYQLHGGEDGCDLEGLMADALALIREQEPVTMKPYYFNYVCSGCGSEIDGEFIEYTGGKIKFCPWCGKKVKWDVG